MAIINSELNENYLLGASTSCILFSLLLSLQHIWFGFKVVIIYECVWESDFHLQYFKAQNLLFQDLVGMKLSS